MIIPSCGYYIHAITDESPFGFALQYIVHVHTSYIRMHMDMEWTTDGQALVKHEHVIEPRRDAYVGTYVNKPLRRAS
jgi:hypothetical protein